MIKTYKFISCVIICYYSLSVHTNIHVYEERDFKKNLHDVN